MTSVVYFIRNTTSGAIKIGYSRRAKARLAQLQTAVADRLELLGLIAGGKSTEADLHEKYRMHRVRGEWYMPSPSMLLEIQQLLAERGYVGDLADIRQFDPLTQQARDWVVMLLTEAGASDAWADVAQATGVTPGLVENLSRNRTHAITARDYEAIRLAAVSAYEARLVRLKEQLAFVQELHRSDMQALGEQNADALRRLEDVMRDARALLAAMQAGGAK